MKNSYFKIALVLICQVLLVITSQAINLLSIKNEDGSISCLVGCGSKIAKLEKIETATKYIFSDTIRICGPAANEKVAKWMQETINSSWTLPNIKYKKKSMKVDVTVIYDEKINCTRHFADPRILDKIIDQRKKPSNTVIRLFHKDITDDPRRKKHANFNFVSSERFVSKGDLAYAYFCMNFSEMSWVSDDYSKSNHINKALLLHEFGHLLCLSDKYGKSSDIFYESDIMSSKLIDKFDEKIEVTKRNVVDVISRFDCYRRKSNLDMELTQCEKESPYYTFSLCLDEKSLLLEKNRIKNCASSEECIKKDITENLETYKHNILEECNKFLPNL